MRNALTEKILMVGVDGMDPRLTKSLMDAGKLPNIQKLVQAGSCREDLVMLGNVPTITPPMWMTLATGCTPSVHGITCFWQQSHRNLDGLVYAFSSSQCKAEPLWDVMAEAGKKTMVFHWPAGSWPPKSENPNLSILDGSSAGCVNNGVAVIDSEKIVVADKTISSVTFKPKVTINNGAGCVINNVDEFEEKNINSDFCDYSNIQEDAGEMVNIMLTLEDGEGAFEHTIADMCYSPIVPAKGWEHCPEDALEFTLIFHKGLQRRLGLILKNDQGVYDTVQIYRTRRDQEPMTTLTTERYITFEAHDQINENGRQFNVVRFYSLLSLASDGSRLELHVGPAYDTEHEDHCYPKTLYKRLIDAVGPIFGVTFTGGENPNIVKKVALPTWKHYLEWQSRAINYLIEKEGYEVIFSHMHNVDECGHNYWHWSKKRKRRSVDDTKLYQSFIEQCYQDTDAYVGSFLHLLNEGWTILLFSDHGFLCSREEEAALMGDAFGVNAAVMMELGYTALKQDENGKILKEIDWSKTKAVAPRGNHIWINLKGRNATGIVDPSEKYALEEEIISALYNYRDASGRRIVSVVMRNKEAAIVGMTGPECGDLIYWCVEGLNRGHGDSMPTYYGENNTSVSPIFIAAGSGIKKGYFTNRVIREVDFAPTVAVLAGVRMPENCEGAPVYQILTDIY